MPAPIDVNDFSPQNAFLQAAFDHAGDAAMKEVTGETTGADEKETQRKTFAQLLEKLACLKGHSIVSRVLGELEGATTNGEFLEAMKRIEPLIRRVRTKLTEAQILDWSDNALSPLVLRQHQPAKPVSALEKLGGKNTTESNAAIFFTNQILPILGAKRDEIQRGAHHVGTPVYRDEREFPEDFYGEIVAGKKTGKTDPDAGIWCGVEFEKSSKGYALLQLCSKHKPGDTIGLEALTEALYPGQTSDAVLTNLKQIITNISGKFKESGTPAPFIPGRGRESITLRGDSSSADIVSEETSFELNADFLNQPLTFNGAQAVVSAVPAESTGELTLDMVDSLELSENAAKVLKYLIENEGTTLLVKNIVSALTLAKSLELQFTPIVEEINKAIQQYTKKIVTKRGNVILFGISQE